MSDTYNLIILGAGPGGYSAAIRASQLGLSVALIEKDSVGGTCLNRGCIPTKALLHTTSLFQQARQEFARQGIICPEVFLDAQAMYQNKDETVNRLKTGVEQLLKANKVQLFKGEGRITGPGQAQVSSQQGVQQLTAENILVATGSAPSIPPIPGAHLAGVHSSDYFLQTPDIPKRVAIVGAGVIGVEFASFYTAAGSEVTLLETAPQALPHMGREIGQSVAMMLRKSGAALHTCCAVSSIEKEDENLVCHYETKGKTAFVQVDAVLLATGRKPVLQGVFPEEYRPKTDASGFVVVGANYETSLAGVYAIGDIIPGMQLAHAAAAEGIAAVENMAGQQGHKRLDLVPSCVYTQPEIALVGLCEEQAAQEQREITTQKFLMSSNGRVLISNGQRSYMKVIADSQNGKILGAELLCPNATDLISQFTLAIANGMTAGQLESIVQPHPTFSEGVGEAAALFFGAAIHSPPKTRPAR